MSPMSNRLMRPRASSSGFDPRSIANCTAWFDATNSSTLTMNGTTVSAWVNNVSGGTNFTQNDAALQPSLTTLNGKTAIFLGSGGAAAAKMTGPLIGSMGVFASQILLFAVVRVVGATVSSYRLITNSADANSAGWFPRYGNGQAYWDAAQTNARVNGVVTGTTIATTGVIARLRRASANASMHYSNTSIASRANASGNLTTTTNGNMVLQGADVGTDYIIGELISYNRDLSAAEVSTIETALAAKWGITLA